MPLPVAETEAKPIPGNRAALLARLALAATLLVGPGLNAQVTPGGPAMVDLPHNVVVIVADDVGVDLIGAYEPFYPGQPNPNYPNTTPVIDYLAGSGVLFRNCWTSPLCSPARAEFMTGRHGLHNGIGTIFQPGDERSGLQSHVPTIPGLLRSSAEPFRYATAAVGKWHLADPLQIKRGQMAHPLGTPASPWFHQWAGAMDNFTGGETYNQWTKTFGTSIDRPTDECWPQAGLTCKASVVDYATHDTADDAVRLIATLPQPYFLQVAFNAVHSPVAAPAAPLLASSCLGAAVAGAPACGSSFNDTDVPADVHCMMQWLDNEIGRIVCAVESPAVPAGLPTTLIFIADNGTAGTKLANFKKGAIAPPFNSKHGKGTLYQGGINVPLIIKSPITPSALRGSVNTALVNGTDLLATVADLSMMSLPTDAVRDSVSMVPYLVGAAGSHRTHAYAEMFAANFPPDGSGNAPAWFKPGWHWRAVRDVDGYKLMQRVSPDGVGGLVVQEEFYDVSTDPYEANNRIGMIQSPPYQAPYQTLRQLLDVVYPHLVKP